MMGIVISVLATNLDPTSGQAHMFDFTYLTTDVDRQCIANCFLKNFFLTILKPKLLDSSLHLIVVVTASVQ